MDEKSKIPLHKVILAIFVICALVFLVVKSLISAKATEKKPEIKPTDAGTENNRKATVVPVVSELISVPPEPEIAFSANLTEEIPLTRNETQIPARRKRKRITHENMATIFRHGSRKLTLTTAVAEVKGLGFGHSAAYEALLANGRFSAWLQFAPDGRITWTDR